MFAFKIKLFDHELPDHVAAASTAEVVEVKTEETGVCARVGGPCDMSLEISQDSYEMTSDSESI